jgi:hypothetical protein
MRSVIALLMITVAISGVRLSSAPEHRDGELPVTIQIHDYSRVPPESLSRATTVVTRLYDTIGVRTEWIGVLRPRERTESVRRDGKAPAAIGQLTIIVLTTKMAARGRVADGVLGFAAVASEGMGRIAYVVYDRVRLLAAEAATPEGELLGFVMAHEIGHLLLPRGPQPSAGVMKGCWTAHDFHGMDVLKLGFSPQQALHIRRTIENEAATAAGMIADDARVAPPRDEGAVAHDRRENVPQGRRATPGHGVVSGCPAHGSR